MLLEAEGVEFEINGRIALERYRWQRGLRTED
jgi:alkylated DNA nucleotide flippase Atl1